MSKLPLDGIRVLDCSSFMQGPVAGSILGELGAEVIKIEEPVRGDPSRGLVDIQKAHTGISTDMAFQFERNNHSKKGMVLNLRKEKGREILYRLVEKSDVLINNHSHRTTVKLKIDYDTLQQYNPRLIYATGTGYGSKGPDAEQPAMDYVAQARSGLMWVAGEEGTPPLILERGLVDLSGATMLANGIILALLVRERTGIGQKVEGSLLGGAIFMNYTNVATYTLTGQEYQRPKRGERSNPLWNHYKCGDGRWMAFAMIQGDKFWPGVCKALGITHLEHDPRFNTMQNRSDNRKEMCKIFDEVMATKSSKEWSKIFREANLVFSVVQTLPDLIKDPQVIANKYIANVKHPVHGTIKLPSYPVRLSKTPFKIRKGAPALGQHTEEVLIDICGYTWKQIEKLKDSEII